MITCSSLLGRFLCVRPPPFPPTRRCLALSPMCESSPTTPLVPLCPPYSEPSHDFVTGHGFGSSAGSPSSLFRWLARGEGYGSNTCCRMYTIPSRFAHVVCGWVVPTASSHAGHAANHKPISCPPFFSRVGELCVLTGRGKLELQGAGAGEAGSGPPGRGAGPVRVPVGEQGGRQDRDRFHRDTP